MKILFFQWHSFMNKGMENALKILDIQYEIFFYQFQDWEKDEKFCQIFEDKLKNSHYEKVLSVNFSPLISEVCMKFSIPYISWVYDAPLHIRNLESLKNSCNRIYFFDRMQAQSLKNYGVDAHHMPLAVDPNSFVVKPLKGKFHNYQSEVSLVGNLYKTEYASYSQILDDYDRGYLEGIIQAQMKLYGGYIIPELLTSDFMKKINQEYYQASKGDFQIEQRELEYMLACETTGRERYLALALVSGHFKTAYYSRQKDERLKKALYGGYVDYYTEMPLVFQQSKINLNISLKAIQTGIPLRVLDVMGCRGFLITNYQEELLEHFQNEVDCVVYESIEDLYEKVQFYLLHEQERMHIVQNAFQKIQRDFTFVERLRNMHLEKF